MAAPFPFGFLADDHRLRSAAPRPSRAEILHAREVALLRAELSKFSPHEGDDVVDALEFAATDFIRFGTTPCNGRPVRFVTVAGRRVITNPFALDGDALALFRGCVENPDDHIRRLVFADYIEEARGPELGPWARWIRKQIATGKTWTLGCADPGGADPGGAPTVFVEGRHLDFGWRPQFDETVTIRNGMIEEVRCSADQWQTIGDVMVNEWPIRTVTLTVLPSQMMIRDRDTIDRLVRAGILRYSPTHRELTPEDFYRRWPNVNFVGVSERVLAFELDRLTLMDGTRITPVDWDEPTIDMVADMEQLRERIRRAGVGVDLGAGRDRTASSVLIGREMMRHLYRGVDPVPQRQFRADQYVLTVEEVERALAARTVPRLASDSEAETQAARRNRTARRLFESQERRARVERRKAVNERRQARPVQ